MADNSTGIADCQRTALLRPGIVVIDADLDARTPSVIVCAPECVEYETLVRAEFGQEIEVDVAGELPRRHRPLWCVGQMEREPGRLQLRFVLSGDEHVDDIVVVEDDESVVVLATVCASTAGPSGDALGVPCHVYLDRPLGGRVVIDGHRDEPVPYVSVYEQIRREQARRAPASACNP